MCVSLVFASVSYHPLFYAQAEIPVMRYRMMPTEEISSGTVDYQVMDNPRGVILLFPGCNGNADKFLAEGTWLRFAEKHHFVLAGVSFQSRVSLLKTGRGYYCVSRESGKMLDSALEEIGYGHHPIFLFGFSGGAHVVAEYAVYSRLRVAAWCAHSAGWWNPPGSFASRSVPPGIVACGEADSRLGATLAYFLEGRRKGMPLCWVQMDGFGHRRNPQLESFARQFFLSVLALKQTDSAGVWFDLTSGDELDNHTSIHPGLCGWIPDRTALSAWRLFLQKDMENGEKP